MHRKDSEMFVERFVRIFTETAVRLDHRKGIVPAKFDPERSCHSMTVFLMVVRPEKRDDLLFPA